MEQYDVEVIDNFLDDLSFKRVNALLLGNQFAWYLQNEVVYVGDDLKQFTHSFNLGVNVESEHYQFIADTFAEKFNAAMFFRIKANLTMKTDNPTIPAFHVDFDTISGDENYKSAVFYLNTNNGYTLFEDGTKVDSIANRVVIFPMRAKHTGVFHTEPDDVRVVINFNFIEHKSKDDFQTRTTTASNLGKYSRGTKS